MFKKSNLKSPLAMALMLILMVVNTMTVFASTETDSNTYTVTYRWREDNGEFAHLSAAIDHNLVLPPQITTYAKNELVTVDTTYTVGNIAPVIGSGSVSHDYEYVFTGWDKEGTFNITEDTVIWGTWTLRRKQTNTCYIGYDSRCEPASSAGVSFDLYESLTKPYDSGDLTRPRPTWHEPNSRVTVDTTHYEGLTVDAGNNYEWVFSGWSETGEFVVTENTLVVGIWRLRVKPKTYYVGYTVDFNGIISGMTGETFRELMDKVYTDDFILPTGKEYNENESVTVDTTHYEGLTIDVGNGYEWVFSGWCRERPVVITGTFNVTEDTMLSGFWTLREKPEDVTYTINYLDYDNGNQLANPTTGTLPKGTTFNWYGAVEHTDSLSYLGSDYQYKINDMSLSSSESINLTDDTIINCYYQLVSDVQAQYYIKDTTTSIKTAYSQTLNGHGNKFDPSTVKYDSIEYEGKTYIYDSTNLESLEAFDVEGDKVIEFYYVEKPEEVTYTIRYLDADNYTEDLATPVTGTELKGAEIDIFEIGYKETITIGNKTFHFMSIDSESGDNTVTLNSNTTFYLLYQLKSDIKVNYAIKDTYTELRSSYSTTLVGHSSEFDPSTVKYDSLEYDGKTYLYDSTDLENFEPFTGQGNKVINFYYVEDIPEPPVADPPAEEPEPKISYTMTHFYKIKDTDTELMERWECILEGGSSWKFLQAPETISFEDKVYELVETTGSELEGDQLSENLTCVSWYIEKVELVQDEIVSEVEEIKPEQPSPQEPNPESAYDPPKTGDNSHLVVYILVIAVSIAIALMLSFRRPRR